MHSVLLRNCLVLKPASVLLVAGLLPIIAASAAAADAWRTYANVRYGFQVCYPVSLLSARGESENGDGGTFVGLNGAKLIAFGSNNVLEKRLVAVVNERALQLAGVHGKISYRAAGTHWAVASGQAGKDSLFYVKTIERRDQFVSFELTYPKKAAETYRGVVDRLSRCFRVAPAPGY